jgi:hypothetical protein
MLSWRVGQRLDFERIWREQALSEELIAVLRKWSHAIEGLLRSTAGAKMPTEWAKKQDAWEQVRAQGPTLADPLPPEISSIDRQPEARNGSPTPGLTTTDLALIDACRALPGNSLLDLAQWGHRNGLPKWQLAIINTVTGYAAAGWDRAPSVKQARWVMDAMQRREAGVAT